MDTTTTELVLNPSFIIPILYSSIIINIILVFIIIRLIGPLRRVLKRFGEDPNIIIRMSEEEDAEFNNNSDNDTKQSIDKTQEDLFN